MINIVYEDNHLLVVEKPVNIIVQKDNTNDKAPIMTKRMSLTLKNTSRTATDSALRRMMWWMRYAMSEKSQLNFWTL